MSTVRISVIIPTLDSSTIARTIASVKRQSYNQGEVEIVVVGLDPEHTIKPDQQVRFLETSGTVSEARNLGIKESSGRWLVFLDSDCVATEQWLAILISSLEKGRPVIGGGIAIDGKGYYATCYNVATFHETLDILPAGSRNYLPTLNLAMPRKIAEESQGMDQNLPRAEDIEWTVRLKALGHSLYFEPKANIFHFPETSFRRIWKKWINTGYCSRIVRQRHAGDLRASSMLNSAVGLLLLGPFIALFVSLKIYLKNAKLWRYFYTWPIVYLTRVAWCWGAAAGIREGWLRRMLIPEGKLST